MANYTASTRSNYFRVIDADRFTSWCAKRNLTFWTKTLEAAGTFYAMSAETGDCDGWPFFDIDDDCEINFVAEIAQHLDPRDVAIIYEIGAEKLRYLTGYAIAIHPDGRTVSLNIVDIYALARAAFGPTINITDGTY